MVKNSDKALKQKLGYDIRLLLKRIDSILDREIPNLENKVVQANGVRIFFYGIFLGLCINLISNIVTELMRGLSVPIQIIYIFLLFILTFYLIKRSFDFFDRNYSKPAERLSSDLKDLKEYKEILLKHQKTLKKIKLLK